MPFRVGEAVTRKHDGVSMQDGARVRLEADIVGCICRVVSPGVSYMVYYEGANQCVLQFETVLRRAQGRPPRCPDLPGCSDF